MSDERMGDSGTHGTPAARRDGAEDQGRHERQARALRENLRKRKDQQRARKARKAQRQD